jgi:hypothetical protein
MAGKGVIQMEELRQQLGEHVPRAVELMARSVGLSTGELIQKISKGTVEAKATLNAFFVEMDRTFGGAAQEQMKTFNGMLAQTKTLLQTFALNTGGESTERAASSTASKSSSPISTPFCRPPALTASRMLGQGLTSLVAAFVRRSTGFIKFRTRFWTRPRRSHTPSAPSSRSTGCSG